MLYFIFFSYNIVIEIQDKKDFEKCMVQKREVPYRGGLRLFFSNGNK